MPTLMEEPMLTTVITRPGQIGMDIKCVAQTIMLERLMTLGTMQGQVTSQVIKLTRFTFQPLTAVVPTLLRLTIRIHTAIMEDTPIILIMTDLMVGFITGMDITGMRITK